MAHDMDSPRSAGKDMDTSDTELPRCSESGCSHPAERGQQKCRKHADE